MAFIQYYLWRHILWGAAECPSLCPKSYFLGKSKINLECKAIVPQRGSRFSRGKDYAYAHLDFSQLSL